MAKSQPITISKNGNGLYHDARGNSYAPIQANLPATIADRLAPHNIEAEQAVLGSLLIDPDAIIRVGHFLEPRDFFIHKHGWIYEAMQGLAAEDKPTDDILLIVDRLRGKLEPEALASLETDLGGLVAQTPSSIHVDFYARIVHRCSILRRLGDAAGEIARLAYNDTADVDQVVDQAERLIFSVSSSSRAADGPRHIGQGLDRYMDRLEYLTQNKTKLVGIPTGLSDLDRLLGGLQRSKMYTLAGRPGMGKSSLALNVGLQAAKKWAKRVALFSLEMDEESLVERAIAAETGIDSKRLEQGDIREEEWPALIEAVRLLSETSLYIDDTPALSVLELRGRARRLAAEQGLDLLIVDYLQLMRGDGKSENRTQEVSFISRMVKALARELTIPVLALSQLSRDVEKRNDKRPVLSDLRESGSIEQDSDVVMFVYRDDVYDPDTEFPNIAEIIVGKQRGGPTGVLSAYFKKHVTQFVDLEVNRVPLEPMPEKPELVGGGVKRYASKNGFKITKKL